MPTLSLPDNISRCNQIAGSLLNNALEAVAKVDEKAIKLDIEYSKESLFIRVENTFDGEIKCEKGKNDAMKVIASRKDGDNHGYGLKNIRKSVEKYNGHVGISYKGNIFSVGVLLYMDGDITVNLLFGRPGSLM